MKLAVVAMACKLTELVYEPLPNNHKVASAVSWVINCI